MSTPLDLEDRHKQEICEIFADHWHGEDLEVLAYGSRLRPDHHEGSDLDLCVRRKNNLREPVQTLPQVIWALRESRIPFLIDILDWAYLPESFHQEILRSYVVLWES
jgi:predicted nucleotidyltransferase